MSMIFVVVTIWSIAATDEGKEIKGVGTIFILGGLADLRAVAQYTAAGPTPARVGSTTRVGVT